MRLTKEEQKLVPKSYEVVGDILIFANFPKELKKKEKEIAKEFLDKLKQVKVITNGLSIYLNSSTQTML